MRNKYFWAALAWTIFIVVCCLISMKNFQVADMGQYTDKYVHFTFYFIFTMLWYLAFTIYHNKSWAKKRLLVFILAFTFGILIEGCQQFFTKDRSADVSDALANTTGGAVAVLLLWLYDKIKSKKNPES